MAALDKVKYDRQVKSARLNLAGFGANMSTEIF